MGRRYSLVALSTAAALVGCIATGETDGPFYPAGFSDGCRTGEAQRASFAVKKIRDETLFETEPSYRAGWRSGFTQCSEDPEITNRPGDLGEWNPL